MRIQLTHNPSLRRELAPGDRRLWLLRSIALRIELQANPLWKFEIYWWRLALIATTLAITGYFALTTAVWYSWARNPLNQVRWSDVALAPVRWQELKQRRGDTAIATALDRLKAQDFAEAFYGLRAGLSRSPGNVAGRIALVRLVAFQDPAQAVTILEEGLNRTPSSRDLLQMLFGLYAAQHAQVRALAEAEQLLAPGRTPEVNVEARFYAGMVRFSLLLDLNRLAEADRAYAELEPLAVRPEDKSAWTRLKALLLIRRGQGAEARDWLEKNFARTDQDPELLRLLAEADLIRPDYDALSLDLRRLQVATSDSLVAHLYTCQCWSRARQTTRLAKAENEFLAIFGKDESALQAFAGLEVNLDRPDAIQRAANLARGNRHSDFAFRVHLTEVELRRGNFAAAARSAQDWQSQIATLKPEQRFYPTFITQLARGGVAGGEPTQSQLLETLLNARGQAQVPVYQLAIEALEHSGNAVVAAQVAQAGLKLYPYSDTLLAAVDRLQQGAIEAELHPTTGPNAPVALPATAAAALAEVDADLHSGSAGRARELLIRLRKSAPDWYAEHEAEFAVQEVRLALLGDDPLSGRAAVGTYLEHHSTEADVLRITTLAADLIAQGRTVAAQVLHDTLATRHDLTPTVQAAVTALKLTDILAGVAATEASVLAALDRQLASAQYPQAVELLTYVRRRNPPWLEGAASELAVREVPLRLALDQRPRALTAFKDLILKGGSARAAGFKLVRTYLAAGDRESAKLLANEGVRLLPDDPAVAKLLTEVDPTAAPAGR